MKRGERKKPNLSRQQPKLQLKKIRKKGRGPKNGIACEKGRVLIKQPETSRGRGINTSS